MSEERWRRAEEIFHAALEVDPGKRRQFVRAECGEDRELRAEIESLLDAHESQSSGQITTTGQGVGRLLRMAVGAGAGGGAATVVPPRARRAALAPGEMVSSYRVISKAGEGGMGEVYLAEDTRLGRRVALKVLPADLACDAKNQARLIEEARAASALDHPNIGAVYGIEETPSRQCCIVMAYYEGETLAAKLRGGPLGYGDAADVAIQIASGLAEAHARGIVHRDIKPSNVFLTRSGLVKIIDFGLARAMQSATSTVSAAVPGTPSYMSPEQAQGRPVDGRTDLWALGAVLYEMIAGRRAFEAADVPATLLAVVHSAPAMPQGIPLVLQRILYRALAKRAEERYQSAGEMMRDLRELELPVTREEVRKYRTLASGPAGRRRRAWKRAAWAAAAVLCAVIAVWLGRRLFTRPPIISELSRFTSYRDSLTTDPAISPNGSIVAFASDVGGHENLDIWVQHTGADAFRLTTDAADDHEPAFSPDGSTVAFRSERDGGGIYITPASPGGAQTRLVPQGRRPRFSPDGKWIAYWTGHPYAEGGNIYVVKPNGEGQRQLAAGFYDARHPIWCPDSKTVMFEGERTGKEPDREERVDWWVVRLDGSPPSATGAAKVFNQAGQLADLDGDFIPGTNAVIFSTKAEQASNLWLARFSHGSYRALTRPERLTNGTGTEVQPAAAADGTVLCADLRGTHGIWALPIRASEGKPSGAMQRLLSRDASRQGSPSVTADGTTMAFVSNRTGTPEVYVEDLRTGEDRKLTGLAGQSTEESKRAVISADGARVAYGRGSDSRVVLYAIDAKGGPEERLCDRCGFPSQWLSGGRLLCSTLRGDIVLLEPGAEPQILHDPGRPLWSPSVSPDEAWLAFHTPAGQERRRILFVPVRDGFKMAPNGGTPVTEGSFPRWSPDGNLLYFISARDGYQCLWAQRLDPVTKAAVGKPWDVLHLHQARTVIDVETFEISVARDKLLLNIDERAGDVWKGRLTGLK